MKELLFNIHEKSRLIKFIFLLFDAVPMTESAAPPRQHTLFRWLVFACVRVCRRSVIAVRISESFQFFLRSFQLKSFTPK